jgi:hypothetical protein
MLPTLEYRGSENKFKTLISRKIHRKLRIGLPFSHVLGYHELAFPFNNSKINPLLAQCHEIMTKPVAVEQSILFKYFASFQPNSCADLIGCDESWDCYDSLMTLPPRQSELPWRGVPGERSRSSLPDALEHGFNSIKDTDGYDGYGPCKINLVEMELIRVGNILKSIRERGYSDMKNHLEIQVIVLVDDVYTGEYGFQLLSGNHRLAALSALDLMQWSWTEISERNVIRLSNVASWPGVKHGPFSPRDSENVFLRVLRGKQPPLCVSDWNSKRVASVIKDKVK